MNYIVRAGDTFSKIAARFGLSLAELSQANPQVTNINLIRIGQLLTIPSKQPATSSLAVTPLQLRGIVATLTSQRAAEICDPLNHTLQRFNLMTRARQAAFIAQAAHESAGFTAFTENLNYSPASLTRVWPALFP